MAEVSKPVPYWTRAAIVLASFLAIAVLSYLLAGKLFPAKQEGQDKPGASSSSEKPRFDSRYETAKAIDDFNRRGIAHAQRAEFDQAIQNYDQAIQLDPRNAGVLYNRGLAKFMSGQIPASVPDLEQAVALDRTDMYKVIWHYLAQGRAGQNGTENLVRDASRFDLAQWPGPLLSMFQGRTGVEAVLRMARGAHPVRQQEQQCEAYFYGGELLLIQKNEEEAIRMLREAMNVCTPSFVEYDAARAELKRMGKLPAGLGQ